MEDLKVPQHFRYLNPTLEALKELGGSGQTSEVIDLVIERLQIPEEEVTETLKSGMSRVINQIHWSRLLLAQTGYLDSSKRGVWTLTEKGMNANLTDKDLFDLYDFRKEWSKKYRKTKSKAVQEELSHTDETEIDDEVIQDIDYKVALLEQLKSLSPNGFERICQRLLRESGFEQVKVTGRSGDGGIDGIGLLQVNPFVSFKVIFQCKRYQGSVTPSQIRDFRGAMLGRADKGIFMTTGTFTSDAKKEARRDGVPPIELVDGEKLIEMFELVELGLKPIKTYEIDEKFFDEFKA